MVTFEVCHFLAEPFDTTMPTLTLPAFQFWSAQLPGVSGSKVSTVWGWKGRDQR